MDAYNITVLGGAGLVGREFLKVLDEQQIPVGRLRLLATARSAGKTVDFRGQQITVEETTDDSFNADDHVVFISASGTASKHYAPIAVSQGCLVIDDSSAFRNDPTVPLVIPEINADDLDWHNGIISQPNCTTTPMVLALQPIHRDNPVKRIIASTYQAVAGAGSAAIEGLREESAAVLRGERLHTGVQRREIGFNVIPQVDDFADDGYTKEELKMANETRKILHRDDIAISATCVRVPTFFSHSISVWAEFERPVDADEARAAMATMPGLKVVDDPLNYDYPTPLDCAGTDWVLAGRVRPDHSTPGGLAFWVVTDSIRKGAATNVVQVMQEAARRGIIGNVATTGARG